MRDNRDAMLAMGLAARGAARRLALATTAQKVAALRAMAAEIRKGAQAIAVANEKDVAAAKARALKESFIDRLMLTMPGIEAMAAGIEDIAELPDLVGAITAEWDRPNGMVISRVRVPIGVIGIIYESRPNVTADAGALCVMSGNAAILRGGSDGLQTSSVIAACLQQGLAGAGLPERSGKESGKRHAENMRNPA